MYRTSTILKAYYTFFKTYKYVIKNSATLPFIEGCGALEYGTVF